MTKHDDDYDHTLHGTDSTDVSERTDHRGGRLRLSATEKRIVSMKRAGASSAQIAEACGLTPAELRRTYRHIAGRTAKLHLDA